MSPRPRDGGEARLREAIDDGRTGDKVPFPDPAAAPLGTDAEAGGSATVDAGASRSAARDSGVVDPAASAHHHEPVPGDAPSPPRGAAIVDERSRRIDGGLTDGAKWRIRKAVVAVSGALLVLAVAVILVVAD